MDEQHEEADADGVTATLDSIAFVVGADRLRPTWRVLLAWPLLWVLTGAVLTGNLMGALRPFLGDGGHLAGLAQSVLHGGFLAVALVVWARSLDRRPLSDYGVDVSWRWLGDAAGGFVAVLVGSAVWLGFGSTLGLTITAVWSAYSLGSLLVVPAVLLVALGLHAAVQQIVFFRVILDGAVEGLAGRGVAAGPAAVGAVLVAAAFFVNMHDVTSGLRLLDLAIVGTLFGLLFLHTGELALGIGAHFGALYVPSVVFASASRASDGPALFEVAGSLPGGLGTVGQVGFPRLILAYLLLVAWLRWRRGGVPVRRTVVRRWGRS